MKYILALLYILILILIIGQIYFYYVEKSNKEEEFETINHTKKENILVNREEERLSNLDNENLVKELESVKEEEINETDFEKKNLKNQENEYFDIKNDYNNHRVIEFDEPNPWNKIEITDNFTKYFIKIYNFSDDDFIKWKNLIKDLDYDITNKEIILKNNSEESALAIIHLILSNFNKEISFDEIMNHNLINISIDKAQLSNVSKRLRKLILKSIYPDISKINSVNDNVFVEKPLNLENNNINNFTPQAYGGSEFAFF